MIKWFKGKKKVEKKPDCFLKCGVVRDFDSLPETRKMILQGIVYGFKTTLKDVKNIPFDIYKVTEEKLTEYKNDFYCFGNRELHHKAYVEWMESLGLNYEIHRDAVRKMIQGIYEYTNGKLDYRNNRGRKKVTYKQGRTKMKQRIKESCRLI